MTFSLSIPRLLRVAVLSVMTALVGCASVPSTPPTQPVEWLQHVADLSALNVWSLSGRLNIRQGRQSDTPNLNWSQDNERFVILLSGTLGLGALRLEGDEDSVVLEKAGEEPQVLTDLDSLSAEYLGYDFPAAYLLWWIRGLPVPNLPVINTFNEHSLLQTLVQTSPTGQRYALEFQGYQQVGQFALPDRVILQSQGVTLKFFINKWQVPGSEQ